jgi:predicted Fe-S protein YdhL (DUF1289 family)
MKSGTASATPTAVRAPCVKVCQMDPATQLCLGCCRTQEERDWWVAYSDQQQSGRAATLRATPRSAGERHRRTGAEHGGRRVTAEKPGRCGFRELMAP